MTESWFGSRSVASGARKPVADVFLAAAVAIVTLCPAPPLAGQTPASDTPWQGATLTTSGTVTIDSPNCVAYSATNEVDLTPGFHAFPGSAFHAIIAPLLTVNPSPPAGSVGSAYSQALGTGGRPPYSWTLQSGALPAGLSLSTAGLLSGTPTTAGSGLSFGVKLIDSVCQVTTGTVTITIAPESTTTSLTSSLNPSVSGQSVTLTATVSPSAATGLVTFLDSSTTIGSATLSGGTAATTTSTLAVASHSITAIYGGDANNAGSTSAVLTQVVNPVPSIPTSGLSPGSGTQDTPSLPLTITGNNTHFTTASVVTFSGTGITAGTPTAATSTSLTVPITIAANAPLGAQGIQVVSGAETVSLANAFTVIAATTNSLSYTYDSQGRLATAAYASPLGTVTVTYSYDAAGNRTSVVTQ